MARQRKLTPERKAFINSLLEHYQPKDAGDVQEMLKDLLIEKHCRIGSGQATWRTNRGRVLMTSDLQGKRQVDKVQESVIR